MERPVIFNQYFYWMCNLVPYTKYLKGKTYVRLLDYLYNTPFKYSIPMDKNRAADGISLRYHFGSEKGYEYSFIENYLDVDECSILEMMIALSIKCETGIMDDPEFGNRTNKWFWDMIVNIGLINTCDNGFDTHIVRDKIHILITRQYKSDGTGGLFTVHNPPRDLREVEIWYQMNWYLNEFLGG